MVNVAYIVVTLVENGVQFGILKLLRSDGH